MAAVKPLVVIVGPTASGKSALALSVAECYNGEIICADSRTVYRGLDIGTAKPTQQERARIRHYGLDVREPNERFTMYDFQQLAINTISHTRREDKLPIIVGGTGLYVDSVLFEFRPGQDVDEALRQSLLQMKEVELQSMIERQHLSMPENVHNKRHLIRTLERGQQAIWRRDIPMDNTIVVGIATDIEQLTARIRQRSEHMFDSELMHEAQRTADQYGWECEGLTGNIYRLVRRISDGEMTQEEAIERSITLDRQLAKRQMAWFKRNQCIQWHSLEAAGDYIASELTRSGVQPVIP